MRRQRVTTMVIAGLFLITLISCTESVTQRTANNASNANAAQSATALDGYAHLDATQGKVFKLDPALSNVRIYAFRAGRAAKVGHNHVLSAPQFAGFAYVPNSGLEKARFDLEFRLDQLEIDRPEYRSTLGRAFASKLDDAAIAGTREHMLGPDNMQADQYPWVRVHAKEVQGEFPKLALLVEIELHGQTHEQWVALDVDGLPDALHARGSFVVRQTEFGAKPYSVLNGLLAVEDAIVIEFDLRGA